MLCILKGGFLLHKILTISRRILWQLLQRFQLSFVTQYTVQVLQLLLSMRKTGSKSFINVFSAEIKMQSWELLYGKEQQPDNSDICLNNIVYILISLSWSTLTKSYMAWLYTQKNGYGSSSVMLDDIDLKYNFDYSCSAITTSHGILVFVSLHTHWKWKWTKELKWLQRTWYNASKFLQCWNTGFNKYQPPDYIR